MSRCVLWSNLRDFIGSNNVCLPVYALTDMQTLSLFTSQEVSDLGHITFPFPAHLCSQPELLQDYGDLRTQKNFTVPGDFTCGYAIDFDGRSSIMLGSNS